MKKTTVKKLSSEETIVAISVPGSLCIGAPAGSGKTYCLITRYLYLLSHVEHPSKITVVTFTNKATNEIIERVEYYLKTGYNLIESGETDQQKSLDPLEQLAINAVKNLSKFGFSYNNLKKELRISTIDSFFLSIYKNIKDIQVINNANPYYLDAVNKALQTASMDKAIFNKLDSFIQKNNHDLAYIKSELVGLLGSRNLWLHEVIGNSTDYNNRALTALKNSLCVFFDQLLTSNHLNELKKIINSYHNPDRSDDSINQKITLYKEFFSSIFRQDLKVLRKRYVPNQLYQKHDFDKFLLFVSNNLNKLRSPVVLLNSINATDKDIAPFVDLLKLSYAHLKVIFQDEGIADYSEVESLALEAVSMSDYITKEMFNNDCDHLLVDEYQDVSLSQHKIFEELTSEWGTYPKKSIFFVGDPLQSIYRFRNPHIGIFTKLFEVGFSNMDINCYLLTDNFRSKSHIVNWVNNFIGETIKSNQDNLFKGIPFIESISKKSSNSNDTVDVWISNETIASLDYLVYYIKHKLQDLDDTVILVRNKSHSDMVIERLHAEGINVNSGFIKEPYITIELLKALIEFYRNPRDNFALIKILKGPWIGTSWLNIQNLYPKRENLSLFDAIIDHLALHKPDHLGKTSSFIQLEKIKYLYDMSQIESLDSWLFHAWLTLKGNLIFNKSIDHHAVQLVINLIKTNDINNLSNIIENIYSNISYTKKSENDSIGLSIATIHASKGMEYKNVILFNVAKQSKSSSGIFRYAHFELDDVDRYFIAATSSKQDAASDLVNLVKSINNTNDYLEQLRLLYVGATRAKENLAIIGGYKVTIPQSALVKPLTDCFPELIGNTPVIEGLIINREVNTYHQKNIKVNIDSIDTNVVHVLPNKLHNNEMIEFEWAREEAIATGLVIHELINIIANQNIYNHKDKVNQLLINYAPSKLALLGLPPENIDGAVDRASYAINTLMSSKICAWMLSDHEYVSNEHTIINENSDSFRIDRIFINDNILWVVDYKSSLHSGGDLEGFLENEVKRYKLQLNNYGNLLSKTFNLPINLCIYFTMHDQLKVWKYEKTI